MEPDVPNARVHVGERLKEMKKCRWFCNRVKRQAKGTNFAAEAVTAHGRTNTRDKVNCHEINRRRECLLRFGIYRGRRSSFLFHFPSDMRESQEMAATVLRSGALPFFPKTNCYSGKSYLPTLGYSNSNLRVVYITPSSAWPTRFSPLSIGTSLYRGVVNKVSFRSRFNFSRLIQFF